MKNDEVIGRTLSTARRFAFISDSSVYIQEQTCSNSAIEAQGTRRGKRMMRLTGPLAAVCGFVMKRQEGKILIGETLHIPFRVRP